MDCSWMSDKEDRLKDFPHSFQISAVQRINEKKRKSILDRLLLERKIENNIMCLIEQNRNDNFASFLLFLLKDDELAFRMNAEILRRDKTNIVARANLVRFLFKTDLPTAEQNLKRLEEMKTDSSFARMHAVAEAEIAFSLASISPSCYSKAVAMYRSVNEKYPSEHLWKFGEALTLRRGVTLSCYSKELWHDTINSTVRCNELLREVAKNAKKPINAKAWTVLGELNNATKNMFPPFNDALIEQVKQQTSLLDPSYCFEAALQLCDDDAFVLERCGKYFRNIGECDYSKTLLQRAIEVRPTAFSYQHLALTLIKIAKRNQRGQSYHSKRKVSKDDPLIQAAIFNLQRSVEVSHECNISALNSLGFLYLKTEDFNKADETFRKIIHTGSILGSPVFTICACEETGLCCLRKSKQAGISQNERDSLIKESKFYLTLSVETAAKLTSQVSNFRIDGYEHRAAFKTITDMLQSEYSTSQNPTKLKELAHLYELIGKYKTSLDIYLKLCEDPKEASSPGMPIRLIDNYLHTEDYDNAKLCLSLLLCTRQAADVSGDLVNRVYLESARHILLSDSEPHQAHDCFQRAFEFKYGSRKEDEADGIDVMILHDDDDASICETSKNIQDILESCTGLKVTRNIESVFLGSLELTSYGDLMSSSRVIVVVLNSDPPNNKMQLLINMALEIVSTAKKSLVCLTMGTTHAVKELKSFKTGKVPVNVEDEGEKIKWLLDHFQLLIDSDVKI